MLVCKNVHYPILLVGDWYKCLLCFSIGVSSYSTIQGSGPIRTQNVACTGDESKLMDCEQGSTGDMCTDDLVLLCQSGKYVYQF